MYCFVILLLFNEMQMSVRRFSAIPHLRATFFVILCTFANELSNVRARKGVKVPDVSRHSGRCSLTELQLRASGGRKTQGRGQEQRVKRARVGISEPPPTPHPFPHLSSCGSSEHVKIN